MALTVGFWIVLGVLGFALALAVQMRLMIGVVVARALRARDPALEIAASRLAVVKAANGETGEPEIDHINTTYPAQVRQLQLARRVSTVLPILILALLILGRVLGRI